MLTNNISHTISVRAVEHLISSTKGRMFSVIFRRRKDRTVRKMVCRIGVRRHLRGGGRTYDPTDHGLVCVWDAQARDYRSIPLEGVTEFKCGEVELRVRRLSGRPD